MKYLSGPLHRTQVSVKFNLKYHRDHLFISEVHQGEKPRENLAQTFVDKNKIIAETNATSDDSSISVITSSEPVTEIDRKAEVNSTANNKSGKLSFVEVLFWIDR
jgi:hypothetical protein